VNETFKKQAQDVILDSIADGVFTVDDDWNITSFNRAAERITGVPREQAIGQKCFDVFHANICQATCALRETMESGRQRVNRRINILNSRGEKIPVSVSTAVLRNEKGEVIGGVETFRDLSAVELLRKEIAERHTFQDIISKNHEIRRILDILPDIATSESTVLIEGPTGSGKQGTVCQGHPQPQPPRPAEVCRGQLRRPARHAPGVRTVRIQERRLYRRQEGQAGPLCTGRRWNALP